MNEDECYTMTDDLVIIRRILLISEKYPSFSRDELVLEIITFHYPACHRTVDPSRGRRSRRCSPRPADDEGEDMVGEWPAACTCRRGSANPCATDANFPSRRTTIPADSDDPPPFRTSEYPPNRWDSCDANDAPADG